MTILLRHGLSGACIEADRRRGLLKRLGAKFAGLISGLSSGGRLATVEADQKEENPATLPMPSRAQSKGDDNRDRIG
jgi:hypothetical protein